MRAWVLVPLLMAGCVGQLVEPTPQTDRGFACAALVDDRQEELVIRLYEAAPDPPRAALELLRDEIIMAGGRDPDSIILQTRAWSTDATTASALAKQVPGSFLESGDRVVMRIYWLNGEDGTGAVMQPGTIAVFRDAASSYALPLENASRALVLHHAGHAFGLINRGIPMQQNHEALPPHHGHEMGDSVMQWGFEVPGAKVANRAYDGYNNATRADLAGAVNGVCA